MTGRGAGYGGGYGAPGFTNPGYGGRGMGWGAGGGGRGHRNRYYATGLTGWQRAGMGWPGNQGTAPGPYPPGDAPGYPPADPYAYPPADGGYSRDQELQMLRDQIRAMEEGLKAAQERIVELEDESNEKGARS